MLLISYQTFNIKFLKKTKKSAHLFYSVAFSRFLSRLVSLHSQATNKTIRHRSLILSMIIYKLILPEWFCSFIEILLSVKWLPKAGEKSDLSRLSQTTKISQHNCNMAEVMCPWRHDQECAEVPRGVILLRHEKKNLSNGYLRGLPLSEKDQNVKFKLP